MKNVSFANLELKFEAQTLQGNRTQECNFHAKYELLTPILSWVFETDLQYQFCSSDILYSSEHAYLSVSRSFVTVQNGILECQARVYS